MLSGLILSTMMPNILKIKSEINDILALSDKMNITPNKASEIYQKRKENKPIKKFMK